MKMKRSETYTFLFDCVRTQRLEVQTVVFIDNQCLLCNYRSTQRRKAAKWLLCAEQSFVPGLQNGGSWAWTTERIVFNRSCWICRATDDIVISRQPSAIVSHLTIGIRSESQKWAPFEAEWSTKDESDVKPTFVLHIHQLFQQRWWASKHSFEHTSVTRKQITNLSRQFHARLCTVSYFVCRIAVSLPHSGFGAKFSWEQIPVVSDRQAREANLSQIQSDFTDFRAGGRTPSASAQLARWHLVWCH